MTSFKDKEESPSVKMEGYPRMFREDMDTPMEMNIFNRILESNKEHAIYNLKALEAQIISKGLFETLAGFKTQKDKQRLNKENENKKQSIEEGAQENKDSV